ncbi:hypothetical protein [Actinomadura sp. 3N407]|uniref:hypothetical protein n=1 Tax=Actinomadura sp. 3N407 TaxID=3457423 RepID=UPI003FCED2E9
MAKMQLMPGEKLLYSCKANAVIIPSQHGLSRFAADELLPLVGMRGKEAIGGQLLVTTLRLVFKAHNFNRLRGSVSTPLPVIEDVRPWRSGLAVGVEVVTPVATQSHVTWSRGKVIRAVDEACRLLGPAQRAQIESASDALGGWDVNRPAETLNQVARQLFDITGARPTALDLIGLLNFSRSEPPGNARE